MRKLAALLLIVPLAGLAHQPHTWLDPAPSAILGSRNWVPVEAFFEVPASTLATAQKWLQKSAFVALDKSDVALFGQPDFTCQGDAKAYLVRAQYVTSGGSWFSIFWAQRRALVIKNVSDTTSGEVHQSAVVVCLTHSPSIVYSFISAGVP
jgi:hypothetical protein